MANPLSDISGILQASSDPAYGQLQMQQKELERKQAERQALIDFAKNSNLPPELAGLAQASPDLLPKILGMQYGIDAPSAVREYQYYNSLPQAEREAFLGVKRANQLINQGNQTTMVSPSGLPVTSFPTAPSPNEDPALKAEQVRAQEAARNAAAREDTKIGKEVSAGAIMDLATKAKELLPQATSGFVGKALTGVSKMAGQSTESSKADARLKVISAGLTSNVPRFEGPQGVLDVELYKQAAADVANPDIPYEDRQSALDTVIEIQSRYLKPNSGGESKSPMDTIANSGKKAVTEMTDAELLEMINGKP